MVLYYRIDTTARAIAQLLLLCVLKLLVCDGKCFRHGNQTSANSIGVYWMNQDANVERRLYMEDFLRNHGFTNSVRISAISPTSKEYRIAKLEKPCKRNTDKDIAVIASHLKAIYTAVQNSYAITASKTAGENAIETEIDLSGYALILEDDVKEVFPIDYRKLILSAPREFGILQLTTSNTEALEAGLNSYYFSNCSRYWIPTRWSDTTKDRKTTLYWSAQAYIIQKRVVKPFIDDVIVSFSTNRTGIDNTKLAYKIVNSFAPKKCIRTRERPCILANCLFADTYIYAGCSPSYISAIPLFTGAKVGSVSTIHQEQVGVHKEAFARIREIALTFSETVVRNTMANKTFSKVRRSNLCQLLPTYVQRCSDG